MEKIMQHFSHFGRTEKSLTPPISVHLLLNWVETNAKSFKIFWLKVIKIFCSFAAINVHKARGNP
jgi:hypothetical protein